MPQISVIVPVYDVEAYLDFCVDSILRQSFRDFELILVDDGSPDRCPQMCDGWARKDSRIKVIHRENGGLAAARNTGLQEARGRYTAFVDSDDWIDVDFLLTLYDGMTSKDYDMAQCNFRREFLNGSGYPYIFPAAAYDRSYIRDTLMPDMLNDRLTQISSSRCNKLYKTAKLLEAVKLCDDTIAMAEDYLLNFAYLGFADSILSLDTPFLYHYRENRQSMCAEYRRVNRLEKRRYYENMNAIAEHFGCGEIPDVVYKTQKRWMDYIYECAISNWSRRDKKAEIQEIIRQLDRKMWRSAIKTYPTPAERVCQALCYCGQVRFMLVLVDMVKKVKGIE